VAQFKNREEYERWKKEKQKGNQITATPDMKEGEKTADNRPENSRPAKKGSKKGLLIFLAVILFILVALVPSYWYFNSYYQPKQVAEEYLKATQLHDFTKIKKLSALSEDSILINLIDWKFINRTSIPAEKKRLDLSNEAWQKDVALALTAFQETSVDSLPLPDLLKAEYKDYDVWFEHRLKTYKPVKEEDGNYYYNETPKIEYLIDLTATNKLGTELKKKYILVVDRWGGTWSLTGDWRVIKFEERE
jgi:hypothetical protein